MRPIRRTRRIGGPRELCLLHIYATYCIETSTISEEIVDTAFCEMGIFQGKRRFLAFPLENLPIEDVKNGTRQYIVLDIAYVNGKTATETRSMDLRHIAMRPDVLMW